MSRCSMSVISVPRFTAVLLPAFTSSARTRPNSLVSRMDLLTGTIDPSGIRELTRTGIPRSEAQSSSRTMTSWATSTNRRVR